MLFLGNSQPSSLQLLRATCLAFGTQPPFLENPHSFFHLSLAGGVVDDDQPVEGGQRVYEPAHTC